MNENGGSVILSAFTREELVRAVDRALDKAMFRAAMNSSYWVFANAISLILLQYLSTFCSKTAYDNSNNITVLTNISVPGTIEATIFCVIVLICAFFASAKHVDYLKHKVKESTFESIDLDNLADANISEFIGSGGVETYRNLSLLSRFMLWLHWHFPETDNSFIKKDHKTNILTQRDFGTVIMKWAFRTVKIEFKIYNWKAKALQLIFPTICLSMIPTTLFLFHQHNGLVFAFGTSMIAMSIMMYSKPDPYIPSYNYALPFAVEELLRRVADDLKKEQAPGGMSDG